MPEAAPDFVVEVLSPSDRADQVQAKIHDWLRAGVQLFWYVDPATGITAVYRPHGGEVVGPEERLDAGTVLPGFNLCMRELLDELAAEGRTPEPADAADDDH
jgi:Uma2 family endonuclease